VKSLTLELNGSKITYEVEPRETLADFLRERCRLTATHLGCEHGVCGACTVAVDGQATRSCLRLAIMCDGRSVRTLEGLEDDPTMEVLRRHFHQSHALQCGFCTPGMLMMGRDILLRMANPDAVTVRDQLSGQICRCTGYSGIVKAIVAAGRELGEADTSRVSPPRSNRSLARPIVQQILKVRENVSIGSCTCSAEIHSGDRSDAANHKQHAGNSWAKILRG